MKKTILAILTGLAVCQELHAQISETDAVKKAVNTLFEGMRKGDSAMVRSVLSEHIIFQGVSTKNGIAQVSNESPADFLKAIGTPHQQIWDERITFNRVLIDDKLASVWADYKFYLGDKFSHCGVDSFQLVKEKDGWKIIYLIDTRRKDNCNG